MFFRELVQKFQFWLKGEFGFCILLILEAGIPEIRVNFEHG